MQHYYALFSGGLDSTLAILLTLKNPEAVRITPLFFKYGQRSAEEEEKAVHELIPLLRRKVANPESLVNDLREYDISGLFSWSKSSILQRNLATPPQPDVENRNMVLIGCAASVIMADLIDLNTNPLGLIVGFKNEHYDTTRKFARAMDNVFTAMDKSIHIRTPLLSSKQKEPCAVSRLVKFAYTHDAFDLLQQSWSCYEPRGHKPCNECLACGGRSMYVLQ